MMSSSRSTSDSLRSRLLHSGFAKFGQHTMVTLINVNVNFCTFNVNILLAADYVKIIGCTPLDRK